MKANESFPKKSRLLERSQFLRVQSGGKRLQTRSLLLLSLANRLGFTRLGIAVSKKYGPSVQRNRFKRLVREVFRRNRELFPAGSDVVVVPKKVSHAIGYSTLTEELKALAIRRKPA